MSTVVGGHWGAMQRTEDWGLETGKQHCTLDGNWQFDKRCTHLAGMGLPLEVPQRRCCTFRPSAKLKCRFGFECCQQGGRMQLTRKPNTAKPSGQVGERSHHHHHGHHCRAQKLVRVDLASLYSSCGSMSQAQQSGPDFRCLTTFRLSPGHFFPLETRRGPPHPSSPNLCPQSLGCQMAIWQAVNAKGIGQGMGDTINGSGWFTKQMF